MTDDTLSDETVSLLEDAAAVSDELPDDPRLGEAIRHLAQHYVNCSSAEEELSPVESELARRKQEEFQQRIFENI